jgi:arginyl-tRNA synthetase
LFDPKSSVDFQGNTGPFIQYTYVRAKSVLKKNEHALKPVDNSIALNAYEKEVLKRLHEFPSVISESAKAYSPALLANYIFELVKDYNSFYQSTNILKEKNLELVNLRLSFSSLTARVIARGMNILGIEMPEKM